MGGFKDFFGIANNSIWKDIERAIKRNKWTMFQKAGLDNGSDVVTIIMALISYVEKLDIWSDTSKEKIATLEKRLEDAEALIELLKGKIK